jgi:hypothetical protein
MQKRSPVEDPRARSLGCPRGGIRRPPRVEIDRAQFSREILRLARLSLRILKQTGHLANGRRRVGTGAAFQLVPILVPAPLGTIDRS